jgi:hypothetical protein
MGRNCNGCEKCNCKPTKTIIRVEIEVDGSETCDTTDDLINLLHGIDGGAVAGSVKFVEDNGWLGCGEDTFGC